MATQNQNRIVDSDRLFVRITRDGQRLMLAVHGEIDLANAGLLDAELERAEETDAEEIVLDLSGVEFIDSTGLQVLVVAGRRSELDSNRLGVRRGTGEVARLMRLTQIDRDGAPARLRLPAGFEGRVGIYPLPESLEDGRFVWVGRGDSEGAPGTKGESRWES